MVTEGASKGTRTRARERCYGVVGIVRRGSLHKSRDMEDEERVYLLPAAERTR